MGKKKNKFLHNNAIALLAQRCLKGDRKKFDRCLGVLFEVNKGLIDSIAFHYTVSLHGSLDEFQDAVSLVKVAAIDALKDWKVEGGSLFTSWWMSKARGRLGAWNRYEKGLFPPRGNRRGPAVKGKVSEKGLGVRGLLVSPNWVSLNSPVGGKGGPGKGGFGSGGNEGVRGTVELGDMIPHPGMESDRIEGQKEELRGILFEAHRIGKIGDMEFRVLSLRLGGLDEIGGLSLQCIGEIVERTRERIRQIERDGIVKIRRFMSQSRVLRELENGRNGD